jgi:hypothetical protein
MGYSFADRPALSSKGMRVSPGNGNDIELIENKIEETGRFGDAPRYLSANSLK